MDQRIVHDVMTFWQVLTCNWKVQSCGDKGHVPGGKCQRGNWIEDDGAGIRNFELTGVVVVQGPHP